MFPPYMPQRWHWLVAETGGTWSSENGDWVETVPAGAGLTRINTIAELDAVLRGHGLRSPIVSAADVRGEAQRRIIVRSGAQDIIGCLTRQLNAQMRATELTNVKLVRDLTTAEQAEAAALQALADDIKAIRAASNALEALGQIPPDFAADSRWP